MRKKLNLDDLKYLENFEIFENLLIYIFIIKYYGFGETTALRIIKILGINSYSRMKEICIEFSFLHFYYLLKKKFYIDYKIIKQISIDNILKSDTFLSYRHFYNFPVNGQKTRTHAKTRKKFFVV